MPIRTAATRTESRFHRPSHRRRPRKSAIARRNLNCRILRKWARTGDVAGFRRVRLFVVGAITPCASLSPQYAALAITFATLDLAIMFGYALLGARAIGLLKRSGARWLERACGGMLIGLAGSLALYRRHAA